MSELPAIRAAYLERVAQLLDEIDETERASLLADLRDQLGDLTDSELTQRLGTPDEFVAEYRTSAGVEAPDKPSAVPTVISALCLPFGLLILFSFGGQLIFGPPILAIEWILARVAPRLRLVWTLLAAALAGEIIYIALGTSLGLDTFLALILALATAGLTALVFYRTTA